MRPKCWFSKVTENLSFTICFKLIILIMWELNSRGGKAANYKVHDKFLGCLSFVRRNSFGRLGDPNTLTPISCLTTFRAYGKNQAGRKKAKKWDFTLYAWEGPSSKPQSTLSCWENFPFWFFSTILTTPILGPKKTVSVKAFRIAWTLDVKIVFSFSWGGCLCQQ